MIKAQLGKEIILKIQNDIGVLARVSKIVADKGLSVRAISCWVQGPMGVFHFVVDDHLRATDALRNAGYYLDEGKVILVEVPHKPGMLKHMTEVLAAEHIDIHHLYASADGAATSLIVFSSADNDKAMVTLNKHDKAR